MKTPSLDPTTTLAQIVLDHPECARVFRDHRLDFCCRGDLGLAEACAAKGIDLSTIIAALERAITDQRDRAVAVDTRRLSTRELVEHIVERHHAYLRRQLPYAEQLARKVGRVHGERDPRLPLLANVVIELRATLEPHLDDEERTLFPQLLAAQPAGASMREPLRSMQDEHLRVGELLATMRALAGDYAVPDWACRSHRALMEALEGIEEDTLEHVHVENHVLAPRFVSAATSSTTSVQA